MNFITSVKKVFYFLTALTLTHSAWLPVNALHANSEICDNEVHANAEVADYVYYPAPTYYPSCDTSCSSSWSCSPFTYLLVGVLAVAAGLA